MLNITEFYVYRLNIPAEINQEIAISYSYDGTDDDYDATDGGGYCLFDEILSIWRQNDDWYCAIHFNDSCEGIRVKDCLLNAYMTIYDYGDVSFDEMNTKTNPVLLFHNEDIGY